MNQPSYWGIMPASVRYADIPAGAKLLYVEITALEKARGHCWATNAYFAELYHTHEKTISRWLSALERDGHIVVTSQKENNGWRIIKTVAQELPPCNPSVTPVEQKCPPRVAPVLHPVEQNCYTPCSKNATHNNTSNNNINIIKEETLAKPRSGTVEASHIRQSIEEIVLSKNLPRWMLSEAFTNCAAAFADHRKLKRAKFTHKALDLVLTKIAPLGENGAIECIEASIMNGWTGVFPNSVKINKPQKEPFTAK